MNILILYTSSGYGHKKIAENIGNALSSDHSVYLVNLFEVEKGGLVDGGTKLYLWILKSWPGLWNFFYTNKIFLALTFPLRRPVAGLKSKKVRDLLAVKHCDMVISTQVNASAIVSYLKKKRLFKGIFGVSFSDFHLHRYWLFDNVDVYFANTEEQKQLMIALGIAPHKIAVCGITLPHAHSYDAVQIRTKLNIAAGEKIILLAGGGRGLFDDSVLSEVSGLPATVILVCGKNTGLYNQMQARWNGDARKRVLGFVNDMNELYAVANVVITKPGGLSVAECLQFNLPIIVPSYLPGQEKMNFEYLAGKRLILPAIGGLRQAVERELASGEFAASLKQNPNVSAVVQYGNSVREAVCGLVPRNVDRSIAF